MVFLSKGDSVSNFVKDCVRTEAPITGAVLIRLDKSARLLHAGMGMATEAGEFVDSLKKTIFYGKPLDEVNLIEEMGDLLWYVGLACDALGVPIELVMDRVVSKLEQRYPEKFTDEAALNRDLEAERKALEG